MIPEIRQIADRIRELREILELTPAQVADNIGVPEEKYRAYEAAQVDIPVGQLYLIANALRVDPTELLAGEAPHMADYTLIRQGQGIRIKRSEGYAFTSLAYNFIDRQMEPMIVDLTPDTQGGLLSHEGQEFNYVLEGQVEVTVGSRRFLLNVGDSIYFNPSVPHAQAAIGGPAKFLTVINERMAVKP